MKNNDKEPGKKRGPLLVTGLPGIPGFNAYFYFKKIWAGEVYGLKPSHIKSMNYPGVFTLNAEDSSKLEPLFEKHQFEAVIDASGCCNLKSCEYNPEMARLVNVEFGENLMKCCRKNATPLIRFSTDMVFDGASGEGHYKEDAPTNPITVYAKLMEEAEKIILEGHDKTVILRIPLPMGHSLNGHAGAIDWIGNRFIKKNRATLYFDEVRSNVYVQDLLSVIEFFLDDFVPGIYHLGGALPLTLFQIGQVINRLGDFDPELLLGCPRHEAGPMPPRIGNVSMDISKLQQLMHKSPIQPWPYKPEFIPTDKKWHYERKGHEGESLLLKELMTYPYTKTHTNFGREPLFWLQGLKELAGRII